MIPIESLIPENIALLQLINQLAVVSPTSRAIFLTGTQYADKILIGVLFLYLCYTLYNSSQKEKFSLATRHISNIAWLIGAVGIGLVIKEILQKTFAVPRPFLVPELQIEALYYYAGFNSFPSAHAMIFTIISGMLWKISRPLSVFSLILTIYICVSRVAVGIHYPFDILVGSIIGLVIVRGCNKVLSYKE